MKQLSKTQTVIYAIGGLLMVAGALLAILRMSVAPLVFIPGVVMFVSMQTTETDHADE